jgi:hypothetical protein
MALPLNKPKKIVLETHKINKIEDKRKNKVPINGILSGDIMTLYAKGI